LTFSDTAGVNLVGFRNSDPAGAALFILALIVGIRGATPIFKRTE